MISLLEDWTAAHDSVYLYKKSNAVFCEGEVYLKTCHVRGVVG